MCRHTVSTLSAETLRLTQRTFHPTTPPISHCSRVNIICGVESLFFHPDPQMKELILCFLPLSLTLSPSHQLSSHLSDSHLDRRMQLFPFSTYFFSVRNKLLLQPLLHSHKIIYVTKFEEHRDAQVEISCIHFCCTGETHSVMSPLHTWLTCFTHAQMTTHTASREPSLVEWQQRDDRLAVEWAACVS